MSQDWSLKKIVTSNWFRVRMQNLLVDSCHSCTSSWQNLKFHRIRCKLPIQQPIREATEEIVTLLCLGVSSAWRLRYLRMRFINCSLYLIYWQYSQKNNKTSANIGQLTHSRDRSCQLSTVPSRHMVRMPSDPIIADKANKVPRIERWLQSDRYAYAAMTDQLYLTWPHQRTSRRTTPLDRRQARGGLEQRKSPRSRWSSTARSRIQDKGVWDAEF